MNFSASELVKRSSSQLVYKTLRSLNWKASKKQLEGNVYAEEVAQKEGGSPEKRGAITIDDNVLFFCVDLVKDNKYIEIKMVDNIETCESWFLESSILQATFYASLVSKVDKLYTPKFRIKEGYQQEVINVSINPVFELWFGPDKYEVYPNEELYNHYINKAKLIVDCIGYADYNRCRGFDFKFKHKEFEIFKPKYKKIN